MIFILMFSISKTINRKNNIIIKRDQQGVRSGGGWSPTIVNGHTRLKLIVDEES